MNVHFQGRVGKAPVIGEKNGKSYAILSMAETVRKETFWRDVVVFGSNVKFVEDWVKAGTCLLVHGVLGPIKVFEGEGKASITANSFEFLLTPKKSEPQREEKPRREVQERQYEEKPKPKPKPKPAEEEEEDWGDE